ncbi:MAG: NAD-dependent epimerase/dehydratase family protein [Chitinophagales bacterium]
MNRKPKLLITGIAGFIGFHLARKLYGDYTVFGIDITDGSVANINGDRLRELPEEIEYLETDIRNYDALKTVIGKFKPDLVIHLAACTGIAKSAIDPKLYFDTNVQGFYNVLEASRINGVNKIIYASSSSVYNNNNPVFKESEQVDQQLSFYGTTKRINELTASNYAKQFNLQCIGLRFFTVYGSWVRKDMAGWKFMESVEKGNALTLYNGGKVSRDFTHVSDIVKSIELLSEKVLEGHMKSDTACFNIGYGNPVSVKDYLQEISKNLNKEAIFNVAPLPDNELSHTHADTSLLQDIITYKPATDLKSGIAEMASWFKTYYKNTK